MYDQPAAIQRLSLPEGRRILVISDIHGNLPYLRGLLAQTGFSGQDQLILDGDMLEKGAQSLDTLRFIMELCKGGNVHPVCGNCDDWHIIFSSDRMDEHLLKYINWRRSGLLFDMCLSLGVEPAELESFAAVKPRLREAFPEIWDFLAALPHAIETERFIFAHAAVDPSKPLDAHSAAELVRCDRFMDLGRRFDKWVVVGHCPVMLYGTDKVCANPVIDRDSRIISIDGGCVLKDDGQLNALIIPHRSSEDFSFEAYDPFPVRRVLSDQAEGRRSYYIRWGDSRVRVLRRGEEFSLCRHERTGYEMEILTEYLFTGEDVTECNDCTDYVLPLKRGDAVRVVEECSRGYFVKHQGFSGWYYGELE